MRLINGASSLFFIIPVIKSFYCNSFITWKLSNIFLVGASFLCNATEYHPIFLLIDHFAIWLTCTSYINYTFPFALLLLYEYNKYKTIEKSKFLSLAIASGKTAVNTYKYVDFKHLSLFLMSLILAGLVYKIRYFFLEKGKNILILTYLFHVFITIMLYISSLTANVRI